MTSLSFVHTRLPLALSLVAALGCGQQTGTSTGNPADDETVVPSGVQLVKSDLPREKPPALAEADANTLGAGNRAFAFDLYAELAKQEGNLFFSPYSLSVALAMTYAGANTTTEAQMKSALHFDLDEPLLHDALNATGRALEARKSELPAESEGDGFELSIVNQAWGQKGKEFLPEYLDVLAQSYGAGLFLLDFDASEVARGIINGWVEDQTRDRIKDLLPAGSIDGSTQLVLTNAIYFKASWQNKFDPSATQDATFHAKSGERTVPMMHTSFDGQYLQGAGYQAVSLPYLSQNVRMIVILPEPGGFDATLAALDDTMFQTVRNGLAHHYVTITLPKFSFESTPEVKPALMQLGMIDAFGGDADLSGLDGTRGLYIQDVVHKAFVAVDEKGTEAAAATAVIIGKVSLPMSAEIVIDRPFLFAIYDEPTGQILFLGHVVDPG